MLWLILTIISAITVSATRILQKYLVKDSNKDPFAFGAVFQFLVSVTFLIYALATKTLEFPTWSGIIPNVVIMVLFYCLGNILCLISFQRAQASEVSIILTTSTIWSVLGSAVFLNEAITSNNIIGIALIVIGLIVLNYRRTSWHLSQGHLYAILASLFFGLAFVDDALILQHYQSVPSYLVPAFALPAFLTLIIRPSSIRNLRLYLHKPIELGKIAICSLCCAVAAITIYTAYKIGGQASIIMPIQQTSVMFTIAFGYLFLNEKDNQWQKIVGSLLAISGVLLLL